MVRMIRKSHGSFPVCVHQVVAYTFFLALFLQQSSSRTFCIQKRTVGNPWLRALSLFAQKLVVDYALERGQAKPG